MDVDLQAQLHAIDSRLARIETAILGNGTKGLAERVSELEDENDQHGAARWQTVGTVASALLAAAALVVASLVK